MEFERFNRQLLLFGKEGQAKLRGTHVAVVGVGGLGTHVVQQLALLGVGGLTLIDGEELDHTNKNRYVGVWHDDPAQGAQKVDLGERLVKAIDPSIAVNKVDKTFISPQGFASIIESTAVFGCLDKDGPRFVLNELCTAYERPYFDLASDIVPGTSLSYGGRIAITVDDGGCLVCQDCLDMAEVQDQSPETREERARIYGVDVAVLGRAGPSVVSINGVVASLGVTEFMAFVTGLRPPKRHLTYHGHLGKVTLLTDPPKPDCYYCKEVRGMHDRADVQRYYRDSGAR
jgi:hypothetical protein